MIDTGYYTSEALTLLHSLIGIPSISREEEAAADFLQNYIEETGIMTGRSGNNIWCISPMFDINKPTILLNSHIDTVKPVSGWRKQPFTPKNEIREIDHTIGIYHSDQLDICKIQAFSDHLSPDQDIGLPLFKIFDDTPETRLTTHHVQVHPGYPGLREKP